MNLRFLLYGANGFVGQEIAAQALRLGLQPVVAGRDAARIEALAERMGVEPRVFSLDDARAVDRSLEDVPVVLHCAGPFIYTSKQLVDGCLRSGTHYLDITGEIPIYAAIQQRDAEAKTRGVMLLPGVGFDIVPSDCLAVHLKRRLPSASKLTLAFSNDGPARLPPGTARTMLEMLPNGCQIRSNGNLVTVPRGMKKRLVDFGKGPQTALRLPWGDVFSAYFSTGIPNIEDYIGASKYLQQQLALSDWLRPIFKSRAVRGYFKRLLKSGSTPAERAVTRTTVWGEVEDERGNKAVARLHGPEAGVIWTAQTALAVVQKVLAGETAAGYQTPARVYGPDFVLENPDVTREDVA